MPNNLIKKIIGNTDIYLLDQILKGRISKGDLVLDAGCGRGRNLHWFLQNDINFVAIDSDASRILSLQEKFPTKKERFIVSSIENFSTNKKFDFIICNAVLHFANSHVHFNKMFESLTNLLTPSGILFIRMTSDIGIERYIKEIKDGVYQIPDGSARYLLTQSSLDEIMEHYSLQFIEPLKTVNVNNQRCMSTLVLKRR